MPPHHIRTSICPVMPYHTPAWPISCDLTRLPCRWRFCVRQLLPRSSCRKSCRRVLSSPTNQPGVPYVLLNQIAPWCVDCTMVSCLGRINPGWRWQVSLEAEHAQRVQAEALPGPCGYGPRGKGTSSKPKPWELSVLLAPWQARLAEDRIHTRALQEPQEVRRSGSGHEAQHGA